MNKDSNAITACSITGFEGKIDGSVMTGGNVAKSSTSSLFSIKSLTGSLDKLYPTLFLIRIEIYELFNKNIH
jgi:hypothetical protein